MNNKRKIIIGLLALLVVGVMGYALFSETVTIGGTAKGKGNLSLRINEIIQDDLYIKGDVKISKLNNDGKTLEVNASFDYPGSMIQIPFTLENTGTVDALLKGVKTKGLSTNDDFLNERIPDLTVALASESGFVDSNYKGSVIKPGEIKNFALFIEWNQDSTKSNLTADFNVELDYTQFVSGEGNLEVVPGTSTYAVGNILNIGTEKFYIIKDNGDTFTALAAKNIDLKTYRQTDETYKNQVIFSNEAYWKSNLTHYGNPTIGDHGRYNPSIYVYDNNSILYSHIKSYESYLKTINKSIVETRLIKFEELIDLGCVDGNTNEYGIYQGTCKNSPIWLHNTSYWTGSAFSETALYNVNDEDEGFIGNNHYSSRGSHANYIGLRPVIVVNKD